MARPLRTAQTVVLCTNEVEAKEYGDCGGWCHRRLHL